MEAARTLTHLPERIRRRRFLTACEELRPLGVAYVLRRFGGSLDHGDAEDVVAEVIIRLDRLDQAGRPPERLRPAFFQSVRNAGLDLLRYRGVRPTAPLEAAGAEIAEAPGPEELAESRQDAVRLREAMARMRPNYREAIVLRFGLDLSVPEIAERVGISLPAAKKLILRSTAQIRERMEAIEGRQFCAEMRRIAERSVLDGELAGLGEEVDAAAIRAHLEHCGACRGFLASLRANLHELGSAALLAGLAGHRLGVRDRLLDAVHTLTHAAHSGATRARLAGYRASGALPPEGSGSGSLLAGTGQKIAAVCTAGAAGAATCVATGIVGPGLGVAGAPHLAHHPSPPPARVREARPPVHRTRVSYPNPSARVQVKEAPPATTAASAPKPRHADPRPTRRTSPNPKPAPESEPSTPSQTAESQFGIEGESSSAAAVESAPVTDARAVESTPSSSGSGESSTSSGSKASSGQEEFGFGG
jgi:RNA polymerase sigma-70 factor (ECF subfamily)